MKLRRIAFICCMIFTAVLFIDGLRYITIINSKLNEKYIEKPKTSKSGKKGSLGSARPINIIILGLDEEQVRSDVITLFNYDPMKSKLNILSIARDTMVYHKGRRMKINALIGTGGEKLIIEKVEEMTGLTIDYYLTVNFSGFRKIIDILGGVELDVPFNMNYDDPEQNLHIHLNKGRQILDGDKAEQFVRYRKGNTPGQGYTEGDLGRVKAQQVFLKELVEQKVRLKYLLKADDVFLTLEQNSKTNISLSDISFYYKYLKNVNSVEIQTYTTPGDSGYVNGLWYFIYDELKTREMVENKFFH
ncbi:MAG TPA: LCP family protein [Clostridia bacterium]|nr:LCP family protein [Clostridia bacterium]